MPRDDERGTPAAEAPRDEAIIPLSRYRAQLSRARTRRRADELLDHPDPRALVPTLSVQELYYAIQEVGIEGAHELVALASPEQVRGFVDLDAWERDRFVAARATPWLDALMDLGPQALLRAVQVLDPEAVALWIGEHARVYDLEQEAPPEEPEGHFYPTPDSFYLLDVRAAGEDGKRFERFIDWLYRADLGFARQALMATRWELPSDLEEHALRWRAGRMADLGFVDYYEALEVYRPLDPATVRVGEKTAPPAHASRDGAALPGEFLTEVGETSFLGRVLALVGDEEELAAVSASLMYLMNRVMAADRVEPADLEGARAAMRRAAATLSIGLEYLGGGAPDKARLVLGDVALVRVFRVGATLVGKARAAAEALLLTPLVSLRGEEADLLPPRLEAVVAAARRQRPEYPLVLDGGAAGAGETTRPFSSLADLARVAAALEEAGRMADVVRRGLGVDPRLLAAEARGGWATPAEALSLPMIVATLAANLLLDRPPVLVPLVDEDARALSAAALEAGRLRPSFALRVRQGLAARLVEREVAEPPRWEAWMADWLAHLEEGLQLAADGLATSALLLGRAPSA